jgi:uncharacterized protein (UPF0332 family)
MTPEDYLRKAERALASARLLLQDGDCEGACNRAYYAMFDTARAALLRHGGMGNPAEARTHSGLIGAFGKHLVKTGIVGPDWGRSLNQVERIRLIADDTGEPIDAEKAASIVGQAAAFFNAMSQA